MNLKILETNWYTTHATTRGDNKGQKQGQGPEILNQRNC